MMATVYPKNVTKLQFQRIDNLKAWNFESIPEGIKRMYKTKTRDHTKNISSSTHHAGVKTNETSLEYSIYVAIDITTNSFA